MINQLISEETKRIISSVKSKDDVNSTLDNEISTEIGQAELNDIFRTTHAHFLLDLIYIYLKEKHVADIEEVMGLYFFANKNYQRHPIISCIDIDKIPQYCEYLHIAFLNSKIAIQGGKLVRQKSKEHLIELGAVYTKESIAYDIVKNTIDNLGQFDSGISILDFACGTGRFYEAIIKALVSKGFEKETAVLNNAYALDIDKEALNITRLKALSFLDEITLEKINILSKKIILKNGLVRYNILDPQKEALDYKDFEGHVKSGFDAIVSNPPYLVLKANKSKAGLSDAKNIAQMVSYFKKSNFYKYSIEGMLNLYQLSIESMLAMLKNKGELGVICPSTLFADLSATKLRKHLLTSNKIRSIKFYAEKSSLFENVSQATNIFSLQKGDTTNTISITKDNSSFTVNLKDVRTLFPSNYEVPGISNKEWNILIKLSSCNKLKNLSTIRNKRGELDLTLYKKFITKSTTPFRLVRGNMIGNNSIKDLNGEYVTEDFIKTRSKEYLSHDFQKTRLICQQISNSDCPRRLKFVFCESYLSGDSETLKKLYILLNSSLLNWRFKITSSNNHINNYELDELPVVDLNMINGNLSFSSQKELDSYIGKLYGLTDEEIMLTAI